MSVLITLSEQQRNLLSFTDKVVVTGKKDGNTIFVGADAITLKILVSKSFYDELNVGNKLMIVESALSNEQPKQVVSEEPKKSNPGIQTFSHRFPK